MRPRLYCEPVYDFGSALLTGFTEGIGIILALIILGWVFYMVTRPSDSDVQSGGSDWTNAPRRQTHLKKWRPPRSRFWE